MEKMELEGNLITSNERGGGLLLSKLKSEICGS